MHGGAVGAIMAQLLANPAAIQASYPVNGMANGSGTALRNSQLAQLLQNTGEAPRGPGLPEQAAVAVAHAAAPTDAMARQRLADKLRGPVLATPDRKPSSIHTGPGQTPNL